MISMKVVRATPKLNRIRSTKRHCQGYEPAPILLKCGSNTARIVPPFIVLAICFPHCSFGVGIRLVNQDAEAIARGNAFAATANNPSALYYNPAGISQLHGTQVQVGVLSYLGLTSDYRNQQTGASARTDYE